MIYIGFRIFLGILGGIIAIKLSKNKKFSELTAFILGFIFPILGNLIIYYSKDYIKKDDNDKDEELEKLINKIEKSKKE